MLKIFIVICFKYVIVFTLLQESNKVINNFQTTDFSEVLQTTFFVDKTLFLKDFFQDKEPLMITAPRRFGKSVILDMFKRFLEIEVDENGNEVMDKTLTKNYKLFTNLKIYQQHTVFFNLHFGTYPVIHVDFSPLMDVVDDADMMRQLRVIVLKMYKDHTYLLYAKSVWAAGYFLEDFKDFIIRKRNKMLDGQGVAAAFHYLSRVLMRHFKRPVIVLIDNYDAFAYSIIYRYRNIKIEFAHSFLNVISRFAQYDQPSVFRTLATGVLKVTGDYLTPICLVFKNYTFLNDHHINKYYGLTGVELDELLLKATKNDPERTKLKTDIMKYYGGYTVLGQDIKIYNLWSILHYLEKKSLGNYWTEQEILINSIQLFDLMDFQEEVLHLIQDGNLNLRITRLLSLFDIFFLNEMHCPEFIKSCFPEKLLYLFYHFHFQMGHLCLINTELHEFGFEPVKMPSLEIKTEFVHILRDSVMNQFNIDLNMIEAINGNLNSISENIQNDKIFDELYFSFHRLFSKSNYTRKLESNFRRLIYLIFKCKFSEVYFDVLNRVPEIGFVNVIVTNDRNITFIVETKLSEETDKSINNRLAKEAVEKIVRKGYINAPTLGDATPNLRVKNKMVCLGICYCILTKSISFSYSKLLKHGDVLTEIRVLP